MIPSIEQIVYDAVAGEITPDVAIAYLKRHAADAGRELRDDFAAAALQGMLAKDQSVSFQGSQCIGETDFSKAAYAFADAMLEAREAK